MTDDLIAWLRAQVDADEAQARLAAILTSATWSMPSSGVVDVGTDWLSTGDREVAMHIARQDPTRVLAEVEANRRILDLHRQDGALCEHCDAHWPCPTVRLVGLPYADRDGYREEWRP